MSAATTLQVLQRAHESAGRLMGLPAGPDALAAYWSAHKALGHRTCAAQLGVSHGWVKDHRPRDRDPGRPGRPRPVRVAPVPSPAPVKTPQPSKPPTYEQLRQRLARDTRPDEEKINDRILLLKALWRRKQWEARRCNRDY